MTPREKLRGLAECDPWDSMVPHCGHIDECSCNKILMRNEIARLRAQVATLRAGLESIARNDASPPAWTVLADVIRLRDIARATLTAVDKCEKGETK